MQVDLEDFFPTTAKKLTTVATQIVETPEGEKIQVERTQVSRGLDILVLGPAMIFSGLGKKMPEPLKALLFLTGLGTILYAANNWWLTEQISQGKIPKGYQHVNGKLVKKRPQNRA